MNSRTGAHDHFRHWAATLLAHQHASVGCDAEVYQFSTISALLEGVYDGDVTVAEILRHGDFGLGTFNHLDGEMVIFDGVCYRLRFDGTATRAAPT
jgi:alpha-acetolactate decarboxylase